MIKNRKNLYEKIEDSCLRCFSKEHQVVQCPQKNQLPCEILNSEGEMNSIT
ncbi:2188_t:CDS:2 [Diversispora eburnea]|uniref:2188_t:CDS:1 n=1 Tax=Diversispora eburnea TaxID=1213867 RepID=A0A9N8W8J3_9GLOM|nr:2188_t:CDS:2 [Diversispora eburnea]